MPDILKRKSRLITFALIVFSALLGITSGPLGNAIELPAALKPIAFPLFLCVTFVLSLIAVYQYFAQERKEQTALPLSGQNRQRFKGYIPGSQAKAAYAHLDVDERTW